MSYEKRRDTIKEVKREGVTTKDGRFYLLQKILGTE